MAKPNRTVPVVPQSETGNLAIPEYLMGNTGLEAMQEYVRPPRLKIVQKQSDSALIEAFGIGSVVSMPEQRLLAKSDESFLVTPLFFFPEFCTWNPYQMKGQLDAIRERTFDARSELAMKSRDKNRREEVCPESPKHFLKHKEHLNFICWVPDLDAAAVLTFSGGEFGSGARFCAMVRGRKSGGKQAPIFAGVYELFINQRDRKGNQWYGFDVMNPAEDVCPWITEQQVPVFSQLYQEFAEAHEARLIAVDYEDPEQEHEGETINVEM
jgi:hypothetical protein